ncbi:MAG: glycosyltransferase [Calditrichia bacterium]
MKDKLPAGKIRIAHLVNYLAPAGKELGLLKLIRNMNNDVFESYLLVTNEIRERERLDLAGIKIIHLDYGPGNHPGMPIDIRRELKKYQIDIVHTHSWGTLLEGITAAKFAGTPIIVHGEHGTFPKKAPHRQLQRMFWSMCDRVLAVSWPLRRDLALETGIDERRIEVILNGVEHKKFFPCEELREQTRIKYGFSDNDFVIGNVGRLNKIKNQNMLIRAIAHLKNAGVNVHGMFVGGLTVGKDHGPELEALTKLLGIREQIHFTDFQDNVNAFYNMFDVFSLTSLNEGCSNVIQEAMFAGRPIIATNVGGNPDLIQHEANGLLVESNSYVELAESIMKLRESASLGRGLAEQARKDALRLYPITTMVRSYERIYLEEYYRHFATSRKARAYFQQVLEASDSTAISQHAAVED